MKTDDPRVQRLLDELTDSEATPEEVCASCPELLPLVRRRWRQMRRLSADLDDLFPPQVEQTADAPKLPAVRGYEVQAVLGRGGMGIVFRALHLRLNRPVALKMILAGPYAGPHELERFVREAEAVAGLRHPNIVQVYDAGELDGRPYFTMELVEGGRLAQKIAGVPQPARQASALVAAVAEAVHVAHLSGIVHRDLTPANILLTPDGTPKVTDFGLARRVQEDGGITLTGRPIGTPSYMAPEQARGDNRAIGPTTDVYALGAILYELLTGRPPFRGETVAATLQQVLTGEAVPPTRLNPRIPRDLQTICLKCLSKDPARRYPSARALVDDLGRFERGEPIAARPLGRGERLVRWARRHPSQAAALAATVLLALAAAGAIGWLIGQRTQTVRAVKANLEAAVRLQQQSALTEARGRVEQAQLRLGDDGPASIRSLLDQVQRDQRLLERLEAIRMERVTFVEGRDNHLADVRYNNAQADRQYQKAFFDAGLDEPPDDPGRTSQKINASAVRLPLVAALDDWAVCASGKTRQSWVLRVAIGADTDAWRRRVRDPDAWGNLAVLAQLARTAPVAKQPLPLLLALAEHLRLIGGDGIALLRRVQEQHPNDFETNFALANALLDEQKRPTGGPSPAALLYQKALALRPDSVAVLNNLGLVLYARYWLDDNPPDWSGPGAISVYEKAARVDPRCAAVYNNLGRALSAGGLLGSAISSYQEALRIDPQLPQVHFNLGETRAARGQFDEAMTEDRQALAIDPDFALAHYDLGVALVAKVVRDEVDQDYPKGVKPLEQLRTLALSEAARYYWLVYRADPEWVLARNSFLTSPRGSARLEEAIDHFRQAIRIEPERARTYGALGQALLVQGRFEEADWATRRCIELLPPDTKLLLPKLQRQEQLCRHLLALDQRLPEIVGGTYKPARGECLEAAELCFMKKHYATAASFYAEALASPDLAEGSRDGCRLDAARAAALAGCGGGDDAAGLTDADRARWRHQALEWLRLDFADWSKRLQSASPADRAAARKELARWRGDPDLAALRDFDQLSPAERGECVALWSDLERWLGPALPPG